MNASSGLTSISSVNSSWSSFTSMTRIVWLRKTRKKRSRWRSTDDGWIEPSSSGSISMRPAANSSRMERSERIMRRSRYRRYLACRGWSRKPRRDGGANALGHRRCARHDGVEVGYRHGQDVQRSQGDDRRRPAGAGAERHFATEHAGRQSCHFQAVDRDRGFPAHDDEGLVAAVALAAKALTRGDPDEGRVPVDRHEIVARGA